MLYKNANDCALDNAASIKFFGRDALDHVAQSHELSLALGGGRATRAGQLVHCGSAYLTPNRLALTVAHRKFEGHSIRIKA